MADGNLTGALITGAGIWDQLDRYDEMKDDMQEGYEGLTADLNDATDFTGFTVTGYGGGAGVDADGNVDINLNPTQRRQAANLTQYANQFFANSAMPQAEREANMYEAIRAMQRPEEQRQYTDLESRLAAQGRLGLASSEYGSSPEMFAYQKAVQEAQNTAAFSAIEQARAQQMQDANIGQGYQASSWLPQAQMQNLLNSGFNAASLNQAGDLAGAGFGAQLGSDAIRGGINAEKIRADLMMGLFNTAGQAFSDNEFDPISSGLDFLFGDDGLFS